MSNRARTAQSEDLARCGVAPGAAEPGCGSGGGGITGGGGGMAAGGGMTAGAGAAAANAAAGAAAAPAAAMAGWRDGSPAPPPRTAESPFDGRVRRQSSSGMRTSGGNPDPETLTPIVT